MGVIPSIPQPQNGGWGRARISAVILAPCHCIASFRSRLGGGDRFDDWVVGLQFEPYYRREESERDGHVDLPRGAPGAQTARDGRRSAIHYAAAGFAAIFSRVVSARAPE